MSTTSAVIFGVAGVFYILTWKYIRQLLSDVNAKATGNKVSVWRWHKGWRTHRQLFPASSVRLRIGTCIALTVGLGLVAFGVEVARLYSRPTFR